MEAVSGNSCVLAFDNTGELATGLAAANFSAAPVGLSVIIRDGTGAPIGTGTINLAPLSHESFMLTDPALGFPVTAGQRGTLAIRSFQNHPYGILGIRATAAGAFTTIPVLTE
ncbi:MAG: hypothetical protein ABSG25_16310 [Bryobacteraceae bacterium]